MHAYLSALRKNKYGYVWVTTAFFLFSFVGYLIFAWYSYVQIQSAQNLPILLSEYLTFTLRDILLNWQSELLQLMWQVAGLAYLLYIGSPFSKERSERSEQKLDAILYSVNPKEAQTILEYLDKKYPRP